MSTRNISWGWRRPVRRADNLTSFMCGLSWNLRASTSWKPQGLSRPVMELLYFNALLLIKRYLLTPWCRVLFEKLTGYQLVKKFPAFHGTRRFITVLTSLGHPSLSWASPVQSIYPHPSSWRSNLILSTHLRLGLPSCHFPSGFPTKTLYAPFSSPIRATWPAHLILNQKVINVILDILYTMSTVFN